MSLKQEIARKWVENHRMDALWLEITGKCNLKCVHCYVGNREQDKFSHSILEYDRILEIVREARDLGAFKVVLTGGEPLLYPHILSLIRDIRRLNFMVVLMTNGTLIDEVMARDLKEAGVYLLLISNYGTERKYYEATTRIKGSHALYQEAINNLEKYKLAYKLQTMLLATNEDNRAELYQVCKPRVGIRIIRGREGESYPEDYRPGDQAIRDIFRYRYQDFVLNQGIPVTSRNTTAGDHICTIGSEKLVIDPSGNVKPCNSSPPLGNLAEKSLTEIWESDEFRELPEQITWEHFQQCHQCQYRDTRYHICPEMNYLETGSFTEISDEQCRFCRLRNEVLQEYRSDQNDD